jgi:hypothetical protein
MTDFTGPSSPARRFFDLQFRKVYEGDHLVLYSLAP